MANPLMDLWQKAMNVIFTPPAGPDVKTDPNLPEAGKYSPESSIHRMASSVAPGLFHPGGLITVNPDHTANLQTTIQHEKVHALLNNLDSNGTLDKLNKANPYFPSMASKLQLTKDYDPSQEAPAYAATGEAKSVGIDPDVTKAYRQHLIGQLQQIDPHTAQAYSDLSQ